MSYLVGKILLPYYGGNPLPDLTHYGTCSLLGRENSPICYETIPLLHYRRYALPLVRAYLPLVRKILREVRPTK